jgi:hypothetical protein
MKPVKKLPEHLIYQLPKSPDTYKMFSTKTGKYEGLMIARPEFVTESGIYPKKKNFWSYYVVGLHAKIKEQGVGKAFETWSTGMNISIKEGDRIFLIRLGDTQKGIVASGYAATDVFTAPHWEPCRAKKGERSKHIYIEFDKMVDIKESPLSMTVLKEMAPSYHWSTQASGVSIHKKIAEQLETIWNQ